MIEKSIKTIFWDIPEPLYRKDPALSQSTLAVFDRKGFSCLDTLFEHTESTSLTFGSCVDCIMTEGDEEFNTKYFVSDIPKISTSVEPIVKALYESQHDSYTNIFGIPENVIMPYIKDYGYKANTNWGDKAKCDSVRREGAPYYQTLFIADGRTIIPQATYNTIFACVRALKDSPQTKGYFCSDNPFSDVERVYQQKFKEELDGITYRGMSDLLIVDHKNKVVIPCDLKTSSGREYEFPEHFIQWSYSIQARLYWRLIRKTMDKDDYFRNFKLLNFRFIVVNNINNPTPLVWEFKHTQTFGDIQFFGHTLRDPQNIGKELSYYLETKPDVPIGIEKNKPNNIENWFEQKYGKNG